jgi:uncharacterized protein (TIGR00369 family)
MMAMSADLSILPELVTGHCDHIAAAIAAMPAFRLIGMEVIGFGLVVSAIALPIRTELTFDGHTVQGGIVGVLADFAAVSAVIAAAPPGTSGSTTSFDVHNLAPAIGSKLMGIGRVIKLSRSIGVASAPIYAVDEGKVQREAILIATALATCRVFQRGQ